jgi:hypothetical protein
LGTAKQESKKKTTNKIDIFSFDFQLVHNKDGFTGNCAYFYMPVNKHYQFNVQQKAKPNT